jgi:MFS family permease
LLIASVCVTETIFGALSITILQTVAPDHLRGRVISVYIFFFTGSLPLGYLVAGWLSNLFGVSTGLLFCAFLCLLIVGTGWMWRKPAEKDVKELLRTFSSS